MSSLTSCFLDSVHRRNRDLPLDAATQYFTLHLYSTKEIGHVKKSVQRKPRTARPIAGQVQRATMATTEDDDDDDYEDEDDIPWGGGFGNRGRNAAPREDSSMKKIKTVQGEEGRWTVTDCDADKKAEK